MSHIYVINKRMGIKKRSENLFMVLKTTGISLAVGLGVFGVCALATQTTQPLETVSSASTTPKAQRHQPAADISIALNAEPKQTVATLPDPAAAAAFARSHVQRPAICDQHARTVAILRRNKALKQEAARHHNVIWSLQTTALVTRFLNPTMYSYRQSHERSLHQKHVSTIQRAYAAALARAHC